MRSLDVVKQESGLTAGEAVKHLAATHLGLIEGAVLEHALVVW